MNPTDFFKSIEDNEDSRKEGVLNHYVEKVVKKYFSSCIDVREMTNILRDKQIPQSEKQQALREAALGLLGRVYFFNEKTDVYALIKKGKRHEVVKELLIVMEEFNCDILVFPVYKAGHWVAHCMGMSDEAKTKPRIIIPGDGVSITIQDIGTFCEEHI